MRKTLLLVFIHGFKGGDDTFGTFPDHVKALISHALPKIDVVTIQYPQFETRGELKECVLRLREWLENKVIDIEVANATPSPTIDPSVHVLLVGHSMGGIVAAETLLLLASEQPIASKSSDSKMADPETASGSNANATASGVRDTSEHRGGSDSASRPSQGPHLMFPHVQGVIAFDTPFLGLAPEMVAHGIEGGHKLASSAWDTYNEVAGIFGWGGKPETAAGAASAANTATASKSAGALPAPSAAVGSSADAAAAPKWQSWGKYAMFAGAAGAVAAGGAAALYSQREKISAGWGWATSHLLFVGDLAKAEVLRKRVEKMESVVQERGLGGCGNFYTNLGRGAREGYGLTEQIAGRERTFCNLPKHVKDAQVRGEKNEGEKRIEGNREDQSGRGKMKWMKAINDKAKDETSAHMAMFFPRENPGFYNLGEKTVEMVERYIDRGWYDASDGDSKTAAPSNAAQQAPFQPGSFGKDWEGLDQKDVDADDDDVEMRDEDKENVEELEDSVLIDAKSSTHGSEVLDDGGASKTHHEERVETMAQH